MKFRASTICSQKTVKRAYYIICDACHEKTGKCGKCGKIEDGMAKPGPSLAEEARLQSAFERDLKLLSERQRRRFFRLQASGKLSEESARDPSRFASLKNEDLDSSDTEEEIEDSETVNEPEDVVEGDESNDDETAEKETSELDGT